MKMITAITTTTATMIIMFLFLLGPSNIAMALSLLGLTFQQVQKYENGKNRIAASRLQLMSDYLQVPVMFFFEGAPNLHTSAGKTWEPPTPDYMSAFLASSDGLSLAKSFMKIENTTLRRCIVKLVEEITDAALPSGGRSRSRRALPS
jgi:hypothetical protein